MSIADLNPLLVPPKRFAALAMLTNSKRAEFAVLFRECQRSVLVELRSTKPKRAV